MLAASGCREFANHRASLESLAATGQYSQAAAVLDDPKVRAEYGTRNEVLWELDRGTVALALKEDDAAIKLLSEAEDTTEIQRKQTLGDVAGQWVLNDTVTRYVAQPYEDIYINVFKTLAQLQAGRLDGGATVEVRRMASKADLLRDTYIKYAEAAQAKVGPELDRARGLVPTNNAGEFIESPLGTFLTAVTFMKTGDRESQGVAARRLQESIRLQQGIIGPVQAADFESLETLAPASINVLVVAFSGRGPTKVAERVGPIPLGTVPVYFELPKLQTHPTEVGSARLEVAGPEGSLAYRQPLPLVEDLGSVAAENDRRAMPAIYARTLVRYALKAGLSVAVTEAARRQASDQNQGWVQLAGVLAGLVVLGATEEADLRSWLFLPGDARVGLAKLPAGTQEVRVVYESAGGGDVYTSPWQTIQVTEQGLTTTITWYWR